MIDIFILASILLLIVVWCIVFWFYKTHKDCKEIKMNQVAEFNKGPWGNIVAENIELRTEALIEKLSKGELKDSDIKIFVNKIAKTVWVSAEEDSVKEMAKNAADAGMFFSYKKGPVLDPSDFEDSETPFG